MKNVEELTQRGIVSWGILQRMKTLMKRAEAGEELVIGFIGGSITQGSLSSLPTTCYAYLVYQWWVNTFPKATFHYVNAGVGGTTSYYGVSRVNEHLLSHEPDFVIVEFSVNDKGNEFFKETYEGLIRNIINSKTNPAVLVVNNLFYEDGTNAQDYHNEVAKAYELPIFSVRDSLYPEIEAGRLRAETVTPDNLHPNDIGHELIANMISTFLGEMKQKDTTIEEPSDYHPSLVTQNRFEHAHRLQNYNCSPLLNGFVKDDTVQTHIADNFKRGWMASNKGDSIKFKVECSSIGVQYRKTIHQPAPIAKLIIDQNEDAAITLDANFEKTWGDSLHLDFIQQFNLKQEHEIEIRITDVMENNQTPFYLVGLILT